MGAVIPQTGLIPRERADAPEMAAAADQKLAARYRRRGQALFPQRIFRKSLEGPARLHHEGRSLVVRQIDFAVARDRRGREHPRETSAIDQRPAVGLPADKPAVLIADVE